MSPCSMVIEYSPGIAHADIILVLILETVGEMGTPTVTSRPIPLNWSWNPIAIWHVFLHWVSWIFTPILPNRSQHVQWFLFHCSTGLKRCNPHEGLTHFLCQKLMFFTSKMSTSSMAVKMVQLYWKCHSGCIGADGGDDGIQWRIVVVVYIFFKWQYGDNRKNLLKGKSRGEDN